MGKVTSREAGAFIRVDDEMLQLLAYFDDPGFSNGSKCWSVLKTML